MGMKTSEEEAISEINVVPLVDIILVVLIIFMVTAPMFLKPSINVNLPKAASGDKTAPGKLNITLAKGGRLMLNGVAASDVDLQKKAQEELQANAEAQAVIAADREVSHGEVVRVLDLVKSVGIKKFAISIDKQE